MNKEQIMSLPNLRKEGKTTKQMSEMFGVHIRTIDYWFRQLRKRGFDVPKAKVGRPSKI